MEVMPIMPSIKLLPHQAKALGETKDCDNVLYALDMG